MNKLLLTLALGTAVLWAGPQDIVFPPSLDKLAEKAEEVVDVTLDSSMLGLASGFMSESDPDEKAAKDLIKGLGGIYIRSFEFAEEGMYSMEDLDGIKAQLKAPEWVPVVQVRSKKSKENAHIYFKKSDDKVVGITILAAEPKELTIVHIVGPINLADIARLGGQFGIPNIQMGPEEDHEDKQN